MILILAIFLVSFVRCSQIVFLNDTEWVFKEYTESVTPYSSYMKAYIPSTVHMDLLANGLVVDPYMGENLLLFYALETKDWIYKTSLQSKDLFDEMGRMNSTEIQLVFEGLDTHADVYVNDKLILSAHNMFRRWVIHDFQKELKEAGENVLEIIFKSSVNHDLAAEKASAIRLPYNYTYTRKAAYQYGWDWGPRLVTCGIWKDVYLKYVRKAEILNSHFRTLSLENVDISKGTGDASVKIDIEIQSSVVQEQEVLLSVEQDSFTVVFKKQHTLKQGNTTVSSVFKIKQADLWWCQGMGKPRLYEYTVVLREVISQDVLDQKNYRTGIRQIKLDQSEDTTRNGTAFAFFLNGYYLFAKGGNYIPPDMFMPRALKNQSVYYQTIQNAVEAHHNMIRLWGGGQFEYDIFYDLCDENGLLIWHDLMFACAMYPADKDILFNIEQEMIDNVKRLRNHPSIALWNGNNEVKIGWDSWGWQNNLTDPQKETVWSWYQDIFNKTLRRVLEKEDPDIDYWPTSPSAQVNFVYEINRGDIHFWNVWSGGKGIEEYDNYVGRFNSEYGMQGILSFQSIKKFTRLQDRSLNTTVMRLHERHVSGWPLLSSYLQRYFIVFLIILVATNYRFFFFGKEPTDFTDYIYVSQVMQAYAVGKAILALRRNKPYCSGSLYWQINDVWPVVSWSSVDYYGNWKALHFRQRHLYKDVIVAVEKDGTNKNSLELNKHDNLYNVRIINDIHKTVKGELSVVLVNNKGEEEMVYLKNSSVQVKGNSNDVYLQIDLTEFVQSVNSIGVYVKFEYSHSVWEFIHYFGVPKEFQFHQGNVSLKKVGRYQLEITADSLIRDFYVYCKNDNEIEGISNNFFDLLPFHSYNVTFQQPHTCTEFKYKSLNQLFLKDSLEENTQFNNFYKHVF